MSRENGVKSIITVRKSKFTERVVEAITKLDSRNGSSAKEILNYVLKSGKTVGRNVTLQLRKALKQAVLDGLLTLRGSRYKLRCVHPKPNLVIPERTSSAAAAAVTTATLPPQAKPEDRRKKSRKVSRREEPGKREKASSNKASARSDINGKKKSSKKHKSSTK